MPPMRPRAARPLRLALLGALALVGLAGLLRPARAAESVLLTGSMGSKALLVIDGGAPRAVGVGESLAGVKVISLGEGRAVIEHGGRRETLSEGVPVRHGSGAAAAGAGREVKLQGDSRGHFTTQGQINGRASTLLVDTGATFVALGLEEAKRLGIDVAKAPQTMLQTANGPTVGYRVTLASVRLGDVEVYNVEAVVSPQPMPYVLLGNSFLTRFQMRRDNDVLTLSRRF